MHDIHLTCNNVQCNDVQCNNMQCNDMQWNNMQCNDMQCNAMQWHAMQFVSPQTLASLSLFSSHRLCGLFLEIVNSRRVLNDFINCSFPISQSHVLRTPNSYDMSYRFVPFVVGLMEPLAHRIVERDVEEKKRNRLTSARTFTSVVQAHRGADTNGPQRTPL